MRRTEYREMKYQNEVYRPCRSFMLRGGIYGRSPRYPWRAWRTRRIFRRVIRIDFERHGQPWRRRTANALAFNKSDMVPLFAYQWRPHPVVPRTPRPAKVSPIHRCEEPMILKRAA
jgi:hypothetical protein